MIPKELTLLVKISNRWGGTMMNAFLFNVGLIIASSIRWSLNVYSTGHALWVFWFEHPTPWLIPFNDLCMLLFVLCSLIQFCAKAFSLYADATAIQEIFGGTIESLRGIKYLFRCIWHFRTDIYFVASQSSLQFLRSVWICPSYTRQQVKIIHPYESWSETETRFVVISSTYKNIMTHISVQSTGSLRVT